MATEPEKKMATGRVIRRASRTVSSTCNFFATQDGQDGVVISFGIRGQRMQPRILHRVTVDPATARRLKDALTALFQKRDAPRVRLRAQIIPRKKES